METYKKLKQIDFNAPAEERADKANRLMVMGGILGELASTIAEKKPLFETQIAYKIHGNLKGTLSEGKSKEIASELIRATQELRQRVSKLPFYSLRLYYLKRQEFKCYNLEHKLFNHITNEELYEMAEKHGIHGIFVKVSSIK